MNILVVEPVSTLQKIISSVCSRLEFNADIVDVPNLAIEQTAEHDYQCIILAQDLLSTTGIAFTAELRKLKHLDTIPIILLTDHMTSATQKQAYEKGVSNLFLRSDTDKLYLFLRTLKSKTARLVANILLLEDSMSQRVSLAAYLKDKGAQVDAVATTDRAKALFAENDYDLLITDLVLSGDDNSLDLIVEIKNEPQLVSTPILAVSAFDDTSRRIELFHLGVDDFMAKPLIFEELEARVRHLVEYKSILKTLNHHTAIKQEITQVVAANETNTDPQNSDDQAVINQAVINQIRQILKRY